MITATEKETIKKNIEEIEREDDYQEYIPRYYRNKRYFDDEEEEELDVNRLGLSSHS